MDPGVIKFQDQMIEAWCCGTSKRGYRTRWEKVSCYPTGRRIARISGNLTAYVRSLSYAPGRSRIPSRPLLARGGNPS